MLVSSVVPRHWVLVREKQSIYDHAALNVWHKIVESLVESAWTGAPIPVSRARALHLAFF